MYNFEFCFPTRVLFGCGQVKKLHEQPLPGRKALLVISNGRSVRANGYLDTVEEELKLAGADYVIFDEVRANPTRENAMDGARKARENACDFVVALGGGSVMDISKMIAMMMTNPGDLWDYSGSKTGGKKPWVCDGAPLVCITTSAGTASEMDCGGVVSNDAVQEKTALFHFSMFPVLSIVDPDLTMSVPPKYTAYQGMDAFFHAAETVVNTKVNPMAEMFALKTVELVAQYLPRAVKDGSDREARAMMHLANSLAGYYMLCTSEHTMEHAMGSEHPDLPHGAGLIMLSHAYFGFFADRRAAEEPMKKLARAMGVEHPASGQDFIACLDKLIAAVGCADMKISDWGISHDEVKDWPPRIPTLVGGDCTADPLPLSQEDYLSMYEAAYK